MRKFSAPTTLNLDVEIQLTKSLPNIKDKL